MSKAEILLTELLNLNAFSEKEGVSAKDMSEIAGFNASARLSELKARGLVAASVKSILNVYWLTKEGIEKANSILTGATEPDPEEVPAIDKGFQPEPTPAPTQHETDLSRENASLRHVIANLEQNARELNARIAALESHQDLISEEGLLEQVASLTMKLEDVERAHVHFTVEYDGTLLTFDEQNEAVHAAHSVAKENITQASVNQVYTVAIGVAKPVQSTVWEAF